VRFAHRGPSPDSDFRDPDLLAAKKRKRRKKGKQEAWKFAFVVIRCGFGKSALPCLETPRAKIHQEANVHIPFPFCAFCAFSRQSFLVVSESSIA
jgi:hypothetical protein